jgi:hypothetical protein
MIGVGVGVGVRVRVQFIHSIFSPVSVVPKTVPEKEMNLEDWRQMYDDS